MKGFQTFLSVVFLLLGALSYAFGQTPAPAPSNSSPAHAEKLTPAQEKYNAAINDFNAATRTFDKGLIEKNITELQALTQMAKYKDDPVVHNLIGYLYLTQNNPAAAIPELQQTVQLKPDDLDARNNLGNALRQTMRYDEAAEQYRYILLHTAADPLSPNQPDPAKVKLNLATTLGQEGRLDESLAIFHDLAAANPDAATMKNYGFFLQKAGRTAEAADALRKSGELNPKDAGAWLSAGELYINTGRNDDAISALNKSIGPDVDPALDVSGQYAAHFALGEAYAAEKDPTRAITQFDAAAALQPQNAVPLYNKGVLQEQAGLKSDAEATYRSALALDESNGQIQTALGMLLADEGKPAAAIPVLAGAASHLPQNSKAAPVYARLGDMYAAQKNAPQAVIAWQQALTLNPADAETRVALADLYLARRQYVSALAQFDTAAQTRSQDPAIQNGRGTAYQKLKQYPRALSAFQKALALDPQNAQAQNNVGVVLELLGRRAEAIKAYKKALLLDPNQREARQNLKRFALK